MPQMLDPTMDIHQLAGTGTFSFSAIRPDELEATEYTLATVVIDETGSVYGYEDQLLEMLKAVVAACKKSPRAENLMFRAVAFNDVTREIHGFKPLDDVNQCSYAPLAPDRMTALYDATYEAIGATSQYGANLVDYDLDVNGIVFIITDGYDNQSKLKAENVAQKVRESRKNEDMGPITTILIGINAKEYKRQLQKFKTKAELTRYIDAGDVTPESLAKLGAFISKSISCQSQALGSGGQSQLLTF